MDRGSLVRLSFSLECFFNTLSPDMFRHACTSQLIANDELYSRPMQLFLIVQREAEARTYHLLTAVQEAMSTDNLSYFNSGSRRYQQSSSVSNGSHFCNREVPLGSLRTVVNIQVELFGVRPPNESRGLGAGIFLLGVVSALPDRINMLRCCCSLIL